jgi:hypothetical protein
MVAGVVVGNEMPPKGGVNRSRLFGTSDHRASLFVRLRCDARIVASLRRESERTCDSVPH